jgi:hypothetical protein
VANAATIQARVAHGYAKAAAILGATFTLYRPNGPGAPIVAGNVVATLPIAIASDPRLMGLKPVESKDEHAYAAVDASIARAGDYIVGVRVLVGQARTETWWIDSMDTPAVARVIRCSRVLTFTRPGASAPGAGYYGGDLTTNEAALLTSWPAAVLQGTKGEKSEVNLPGDTRLPWVAIALPSSVPVQLREGDFAVDDQAQPMRYAVSGAIQTARAWSLTASLAVV